MTNNKSFEENLDDLQAIVDRLQQGDVPLEEAMEQFQKGVQLSQNLEKTLSEAEEKLTKVMDAKGQESNFKLNNSESAADK